ncbi:UDP-N-acetylglucosamine 2-epimerase (non-hydrolyzing) [Paraeggerthella hongkongensis]|uniref:non-hydrolyzing UDP-N-acetylglucosamine 2-epimerase n=1 Tax=Paraeggerthella sp. TaxID=2897350 RepID=UPI000DF74ABB|nr:UDP-N-acetylglucosamine 2-epimerase (non-hydrolyzing) [Paraeggerthella hongkongensis]
MRVLSIFGTRPEAIKMAPLVKKLESEPLIDSVLCVTGQHREMLDQVLEAFHLEPDFDLAVMKSEQTLSSITTGVLSGITDTLETVRPDLVLVHGDTTTSMSAALGAFYQQIPIGHVEAGLRTHNRYSPFPEEMNRKLISALATFHFAPTQKNKDALYKEGIVDRVWVTGNTALDAFAYTMRNDYKFNCAELNRVDFSRPTILLTAHRRENLGEPLRNICSAIRNVCAQRPDAQVIYPVHLNPSVQNTVREILGDLPNVILVNPVDVIDMHNLMALCSFVMTDSGGLQEEAPFLDKPVLVLRRETEREEIIETGAAILVGTETTTIEIEMKKLLDDKKLYQAMAAAACPYGDGHAAERIVKHILSATSGGMNA